MSVQPSLKTLYLLSLLSTELGTTHTQDLAEALREAMLSDKPSVINTKISGVLSERGLMLPLSKI